MIKGEGVRGHHMALGLVGLRAAFPDGALD